MKGRWKFLFTLGGLAATALVYKTFEGDPENRRKRKARKGESEKRRDDRGEKKEKRRES